jgi:hypothetical protein
MSLIIRPGALPPCTPTQERAQKTVELVMDGQGRTAIRLLTDGNEVKFLPMINEGIFVTYASVSNFKMRFPFSQKDPQGPEGLRKATVRAAARCYVTHATFAGASEEALAELEKLVPITKKEKETIMTVKKSSMKPETEKSGKKVPEKKAAAPKAAAPKVAGDGTKKRSGAAATFRELIMQGRLTDDQIFTEVQKRHPDISADKRSYVAWYRNDLKKKGENPPAPKKA